MTYDYAGQQHLNVNSKDSYMGGEDLHDLNELDVEVSRILVSSRSRDASRRKRSTPRTQPPQFRPTTLDHIDLAIILVYCTPHSEGLTRKHRPSFPKYSSNVIAF